MKQAPLQLIDYWVLYIQVRANGRFEAAQPVHLDAELIDLQSDVQRSDQEIPEGDGTLWRVALRIEQAISEEEDRNIPYAYTLEMQGVVAAHPDLKGERLQRAVEVNGPSMLFGCAREILRAATGRGPYAPILIPATNFLSRLPRKKVEHLPSSPSPVEAEGDELSDVSADS